jgi:hypothetical protein
MLIAPSNENWRAGNFIFAVPALLDCSVQSLEKRENHQDQDE